MKRLSAFALILALLSTGEAREPAGIRSVRSVTGEFIAYPANPPFQSRFYRGDTNSISLNPAQLAISSERINQALWRKLDLNAAASGKIFLHLRPAHRAIEPATIVVERAFDGWAYHIDLPDSISPTAFLRAVVQASLLEIANRDSETQSAEIPLWLAEGLSEDLIATENVEYLLLPPQSKVNGLMLNRNSSVKRRHDPILHSQEVLRTVAPLNFEQLSWPKEQQLDGRQLEAFRGSAHLFVRQLLELPNGPACFRTMLRELPRKLNWQFAFLEGFHRRFKSQLDVEKWWALQLVQFTGRDLMRAWTPETSWEKLDEIVRAPATVRTSALEMPRVTQVTLQTIIHDWDAVRQQQALRRKLQELELLRTQVAPELLSVVDDYRMLLTNYLKRQNFSGGFFGLLKPTGPIRNHFTETTLQQLDALDAKRAALKQELETPVQSAAR